MLQAEAVESRSRNDSSTRALEKTSGEETCPQSKFRVVTSGLCFKIMLVLYLRQQFFREARSLDVNILRISHRNIAPSQLSFLLMS